MRLMEHTAKYVRLSRIRCINDQELLVLSKALKVTVNDLYP